MDIAQKIEILANGAKYDVSCSSSGSKRKNSNNGVGNGAFGGICHSWAADGRCISLLKILMNNNCAYNCQYCVNAACRDGRRVGLSPQELSELTMNFYRRNYIEGLFLSSAVVKNPDYTMELMINTIKKLRLNNGFHGYIHMKVIPGADEKLIAEAGKYADRMSVNLELPSWESLKLLAPEKEKKGIIKPMTYLHNRIAERKTAVSRLQGTDRFLPAGQTTQMMVGATAHSDRDIIHISERLYKSYEMKRVYYSAFMDLNNPTNNSPLWRENRLYQADWLMRFYGFEAGELLSTDDENFNENYDPKVGWALNNLHYFPVEINTADYDTLLRVPGIGVRSAKAIMRARKVGYLDFEEFCRIGAVGKRAVYFITCKGKYYGGINPEPDYIKAKLMKPQDLRKNQLNIFDFMPAKYVQLESEI